MLRRLFPRLVRGRHARQPVDVRGADDLLTPRHDWAVREDLAARYERHILATVPVWQHDQSRGEFLVTVSDAARAIADVDLAAVLTPADAALEAAAHA